ncbi:hypothetical protein FYK55_19845 [Roseiconus nitratireducens]|uniref:Uncharacterized protein n=1 Tax=Roseiconus nitratireducens TaxID=2605748 RepID=A0A5M6D4H1_9BACT|nr:hypothetical protein [Roseiconus nitratireducens]KAA5540649.1 hypothetical protein FYK55_19845 [Roseiconus nitratireducens]
MKDRSTLVDLLLAFAAVYVLTLACWPKSKPRQIVRCQISSPQSSGPQWRTYSLAIDDPQLKQLHQKLDQWNSLESDPGYVTAKWQKELAEFYAQGKRRPHASPTAGGDGPTATTRSDSIATASYELDAPDALATESPSDLQPIDPDEVDAVSDVPSPSDADYWSSVKASAEQLMRTVASKKSHAPIVFERVTPAARPQLAYHIAFLLGLASACGYMHWMNLCPTRRERPLSEQTVSVLVRLGTFGGMIVLAMIGSVVVWL